MSPRSLVSLLATGLAFGQSQNIITTVAGTDWLFPGDGKPAFQAPLGGALGLGVAVDGRGNYYIADSDNLMVMKVTPDGVLHVIAGNGIDGYSGDGGLAVDAAVFPLAVAVDSRDNVYVSEGSRVRKVDPNGIITTVAGTGDYGFSGDGGLATQATFQWISAMAIDSADNIYALDQIRIRRITPGGTVVTVAGNGQYGYTGDGGPALKAALNLPAGVAVDRAGNLFFTELNSVREVTASGTLTTVPGTFTPGSFPRGITIDSAGDLYVADATEESIFKISPATGATSRLAGLGQTGASGYSGDGGPAASARLAILQGGLAVDSANNLYIGDDGNRRVRKVASGSGIISTVAGNGLFRYSGEGVPATSATLYYPNGIAFDGSGNAYVSEPFENRVRKIAANGLITTFAGTGEGGYSGDNGPASAAELDLPRAVAADHLGNVYIADEINSVIRKVTPDGRIVILAGHPRFSGYGGDNGPAASAYLSYPQGLAVDAAGVVYIADTNNNRIRKVGLDGTISLVAGSGQKGFADGPAASASFRAPLGLAVDPQGAVYVADSGNSLVRKISNGAVTTVAGNGREDFGGDGRAAVNAALDQPSAVALDGAGNLYIADSLNYRIREVTPQGIISTIAGDGNSDYAGDGGTAAAASLDLPSGLAFDAAGNLFIADEDNHRVRAILVVPPVFRVAPQSLSYSLVSGEPVQAQNVYVAGSIPGIPFTITADDPWVSATPANGTTPATVQVNIDSTQAGGLSTGITVASPLTSTPPQKVVLELQFNTKQGPGSFTVDPGVLAFSLFEGSPAATQSMTVFSSENVPAGFTASIDSTSTWLRVSPASGTVPANGQVSLQVTADPAHLTAGTYTGRVIVTDLVSGTTATRAVTATVSAAPQSMRLTQSGLTFTAVASGGVTPPQSVGVLNLGRGSLNWTASPASLTGVRHRLRSGVIVHRAASPRWLSVANGIGSSGAGRSTIPQFIVSVDHAGLAPGNYYASVHVGAPDADNSPQFVLVVLTVLPAGSQPTPIPQPAALVFSAVAGGTSPGSQVVTVTNLTGRTYNYTTGRVTQQGNTWFTHIPGAGAIPPGDSGRLVVQPLANGLSPGIYRGALTLSFDDGSVRTVGLVFVVAAPASVHLSSQHAAASACVPTKLIPVFTSFSSESTVPAAWPQTLAMRVVDDCGSPMVSGSVVARFSAGIPPLALTSLGEGNWSGTWQTRNTASSGVTIDARAEIPEQQLAGTAQVTGSLSSNPDPPELDADAVVNAASLASQTPLAPGALIRISGKRLAQTVGVAGAFPLPTELAGTQVTVGGDLVPLTEVGSDHITAVLPFDVPVNTDAQLIVLRGGSAAAPESVTIAPAQPGIFTKDGSGSGQGLVYKLNQDGSRTLAEPDSPATPGEVIAVECAGLGSVDPPLPAGAAVPGSPPSKVFAPMSMMIGGAAAAVTEAILQPGAAGVYLVTARVPPGATTGDAVPAIVTAGTQSSPPVTMAIR